MNNYCLVADATIDLPADIIEKQKIKVIPMEFTLGDKTYLHYPDERNLKIDEFYDRLKEGQPSTTTQISPTTYIDFFRPIFEEGLDIIYICLSSGLSGTYNSSQIAASELIDEFPERKITLIDSLCASIGEGLLVYLASEKMNAGATYQELVDFIEETKVKCCHWFTVEDLIQLKRGGRITTVEAALGSALKICPVLSTDRKGKLKVISKVRGAKRGIDYLVNRLINDGQDLENQTIIIAHSKNVTNLENLKQEIFTRTNVKNIILSNIGPVIGTHTGSGMLALTFVGENYKDI